MTMMNGLEMRDIDLLDEEFFGPPPRFLVEGYAGHGETEAPMQRMTEDLSVFPGLGKLRQFIAAW
jgi:hypothetical protein